jgi:hypothetical protein
MSLRPRLVAALLRIYPARWRAEYGAELTDLLLARPLGVATIADVVWNGCRERVRSLDLATLFGLAAMAAILALLGWNLVGPQPHEHAWTRLLEPTGMTFPTITIRPLASGLYVVFVLWCGCAIHLREGATPMRSGIAAMKVSFIASLPIMVVGALMFLEIIDRAGSPAPLSILLAPLSHLGQSWIWGTLGGSLGQWIARRRAHWLSPPLP